MPGAACLISVVDGENPGVVAPANETVECDAVPPPGTPGVSDNCDANLDVEYSFAKIPGNCPGNYTLKRTWEAKENCLNNHSDTQTITVQDTTPPVITESTADASCIWPPNHQMVEFLASNFAPDFSGNCSEPITWLFDDCASDQPDDAKDASQPGFNGDGHTFADCAVGTGEQSFEVRAERAGSSPNAKDGRR